MLGERLWMDVPFGQRPARDADDPGLRRLATFLSALLARSQSHRNGLRQAQGALAKAGRQNHRGSLAGNRQHLSPIQTNRMLEFLPSRRICSRLHMTVRCSRARPYQNRTSEFRRADRPSHLEFPPSVSPEQCLRPGRLFLRYRDSRRCGIARFYNLSSIKGARTVP